MANFVYRMCSKLSPRTHTILSAFREWGEYRRGLIQFVQGLERGLYSKGGGLKLRRGLENFKLRGGLTSRKNSICKDCAEIDT